LKLTRAGLTLLVFSLALTLATASQATPINNDFSSGLDAWTTIGPVTADDGGARLSDDGDIYSALYQGEALTATELTLSFDLRSDLSDLVPADPWGFPDTFFATLYLTDDLSSFDLEAGIFDDAIPLFDFDYMGAFNLTGSLSPSSNRDGWLSYELSFATALAYAIPTFELWDGNFSDADSAMWIDNVVLEATNPIPEPTAAALFAAGLAMIHVTLRRRPCSRR
jgi:hypothetical protein